MNHPESHQEYEAAVIAEAKAEALGGDPVYLNIGYRRFTSRSKGIRNGKQRIRRRWREVELVRYQTGWHYPHRSQLDCVAQELKVEGGDDELLWQIRDKCGPDAGRDTPGGLM